MNILIRYGITVLLLCLIGWIIHQFFSRRQRQAIHEVVSLIAKILLTIAAISLLWAMWQR